MNTLGAEAKKPVARQGVSAVDSIVLLDLRDDLRIGQLVRTVDRHAAFGRDLGAIKAVLELQLGLTRPEEQEKVTGLALVAYGFHVGGCLADRRCGRCRDRFWTAVGRARKTPPFRTPNCKPYQAASPRSPTFGLAGSIEMVPND